MQKILPYIIVAVASAGMTFWLVKQNGTAVEGSDVKMLAHKQSPSSGEKFRKVKPAEVARDELKPEKAALSTAPTDDSSGYRVRVRVDELSPSLVEEELSPATMDDLRKLFEKANNGKTSDAHFLQDLCCYQPRVVLAAARSIMRFGSSEEKRNALWAVGMMYSPATKNALEGRQGVATDGQETPVVMVSSESGNPGESVVMADDTAGQSSVAEDNAQKESCGLLEVVSAGLGDADADVRGTAFEVMMALPDSESSVMASQILSGSDGELKRAVMDSIKGAEDDLSVRISLMGAGSDDAETRSAALDNLKSISGQTFKDQEDASAWYAEHAADFRQEGEIKPNNE